MVYAINDMLSAYSSNNYTFRGSHNEVVLSLILGAVNRNWGWLCKMTKFPHSAWKLSTACTLGTFEGKESHFKIYAYAPVKPGNYETPPTEKLDWPSHCLRRSQNYIKMLQPHS